MFRVAAAFSSSSLTVETPIKPSPTLIGSTPSYSSTNSPDGVVGGSADAVTDGVTTTWGTYGVGVDGVIVDMAGMTINGEG